MTYGQGMDMISYFASLIALGFGALLGLKGMLDPAWAAKLVRLQPENTMPEGFAEFRGTFGGMFLGLHLVALLILVLWKGDAAIAACMILAAGWLFTALGRAIAYLSDTGARHPFVQMSIGIEVIVGVLIGFFPLMQLI
jgi:hypothetical protein